MVAELGVGGVPKKKILKDSLDSNCGLFERVWAFTFLLCAAKSDREKHCDIARTLLEKLCLFIAFSPSVCVSVCVGGVSIYCLPISSLSLGFAHAHRVFPARASRLANEAEINRKKTKPSRSRVCVELFLSRRRAKHTHTHSHSQCCVLLRR